MELDLPAEDLEFTDEQLALIDAVCRQRIVLADGLVLCDCGSVN